MEARQCKLLLTYRLNPTLIAFCSKCFECRIYPKKYWSHLPVVDMNVGGLSMVDVPCGFVVSLLWLWCCGLTMVDMPCGFVVSLLWWICPVVCLLWWVYPWFVYMVGVARVCLSIVDVCALWFVQVHVPWGLPMVDMPCGGLSTVDGCAQLCFVYGEWVWVVAVPCSMSMVDVPCGLSAVDVPSGLPMVHMPCGGLSTVDECAHLCFVYRLWWIYLWVVCLCQLLKNVCM